MSVVIEKVDAVRREGDLESAVRSLRPGETCVLDRPITVEEFCRLGFEDGNYELVAGAIYMSPPPSDAHEDVQSWLLTVLRGYVEVRGLGQVRGSRSGVRVGSTSLPEPDLLFFRTENLDRMSPTGVHGAPDFVVEIVDSDRARRDATRKQAGYQDAGVTELWVIDLPRRELRAFLLREGSYEAVPVVEGEAVSATVDGLRLRVEWLFAGPSFPRSLDVVNGLVSG